MTLRANPRLIEYRLIEGADVADLNAQVNYLMDEGSTDDAFWAPQGAPTVSQNDAFQLMFLLRPTRPNKLGQGGGTIPD